jgi:hypothetical protein
MASVIEESIKVGKAPFGMLLSCKRFMTYFYLFSITIHREKNYCNILNQKLKTFSYVSYIK